MTFLDAGDTRIDLVAIPPGEFVMGSTNAWFSETPPHHVTIARAFSLSRYPITQRQWRAVQGTNPSRYTRSADHPADGVSWSEATRFCLALSERTGRTVRLPSEAEWEYACRAGTASDFFFDPAGPFVDDASIPFALRDALDAFAWFDLNSGDTTHAVGEKRPNPWGLHDIIGNVWEWCADHWHDDYDGAPSDGTARVDVAPSKPLRVLRGGAWNMDAFRCRSSYRSWDHEELGTDRFGVRICVEE